MMAILNKGVQFTISRPNGGADGSRTHDLLIANAPFFRLFLIICCKDVANYAARAIF